MTNLFTKNKNGEFNGVRRTVILKKLRDAGYRNLSDGGMLKDSILCKETSNQIKLANLDDMWNYILSFAEGNKHKEELICKYKEPMLQRIVAHLDRIKYTPYKDDRHTCRLFFNNGVLEIYKNGKQPKLITWDDFEIKDNKIWADSVSKINIDADKLKDYRSGVFYKFCRNVVGGEGMKNLMIAIGYMIYSYKDKSKAYTIVLSEGDESDNNKSSGGTGKTLIAEDLIKCVRSQSFIDGKSYKSDSSFKLQTVDKYSDTVLIDDVEQKFAYKGLYPSVTGTMTIENKNLKPTQLPFMLSPKIIITTNYGLIANDISDRRRRRVIGVKNYYGEHLTPFDEFNHIFFEQWDGDRAIEWQYCFGFIIACVKMFFKNNCIVNNHNHTTIETKALANAQNPDLMEYCIDNYSKYLGEETAITHSEWTGIVVKITGKSRDSGWKPFRRAMEAIGLECSSGIQSKDQGINIRRYYFIVGDIEKLHRVLKGADINTDHNGVVLIKSIKTEPIPDEFTHKDDPDKDTQIEVPDF